jgi:carboxymethylenebutenolidase
MPSETVEFRSNGGTAEGYLSVPESGKGAGVVVIQEWWGLVPHIKDVCERFAREGFVALAPDLYHGKTTRSPDEAGKMMMAMRIDEAARDLAGAIDYVAALPENATHKVGTVGFCMGGALSLYAASKNPEVSACVVFYGGHPNVKPDLASLKAPVLGIYAGKDGFVTPDAVSALDAELSRLGKRHEFHTYPGAAHAFFNDTRPEVHDPAASADAWAKTIAFLRRELGPAR